jgi:L-seryl-tRNA(Ser) seleniumtransferase
MKQHELKKLPGVDVLLNHPSIAPLVDTFGHNLVTHCVRTALDEQREAILKQEARYDADDLIDSIIFSCRSIGQSSLKPVINGSGIVLHTNLSRAPMGEHLLQQITPILQGYSNLEFNLQTGRRGQRNDHVTALIRYITRSEAAVVVNNNAAAVMLTLQTLAKGAEVIVSRGELIEIGGSFRIPDIMAASGATMVEVGTTNRTRIQDYEAAITPNTRILFKAHKSNYYIGGFTEEPTLAEMVALGKKHNCIVFYDMGSGLLRRPKTIPLEDEPDVYSAIEAGVDLISFSGDKLLGGPQAGMVVGKKALVDQLAKAPMMRALRVGKMTIAALTVSLRNYLRDEDLLANMPFFMMLNRSNEKLQQMAQELIDALAEHGLSSAMEASFTQVGGGSLPHLKIPSQAVEIALPEGVSPKSVFMALLRREYPVLTIVREGRLMVDVLSLFENQIAEVAHAIAEVCAQLQEVI